MKKLYLLLGILVFSFAALQLAAPSVAQAYAGNCYAYASKGCISNISYWYDSCGAIQAVNQNCNSTHQICSGGSCIGGGGTTTNTNYTNDNNNNQYNQTNNYPVQTYIQNYRTACYNNNIFWYDSNSIVQSMAQSCSDSNSCTIDSCSSNKCNNVLKCDGSTCAINSADYIAHCTTGGQTNTQNTQNTTNTTTTTTTNNNNGQVAGAQTSSGGLAVIMFVAKTSTPTQWSKSLDATNGDNLNFIVILKNTSPSPINNVVVQTNLTNNIAYTGNFKIDNNTSAGSIVSGIDIGTLAAGISKAISFTGTVQAQNVQTIQVSSNASSSGMSDSDYLTINVPTGTTAAAAISGSGFVNFVKKWYLWVLIIIVLLILFVIIFRRLSTSA